VSYEQICSYLFIFRDIAATVVTFEIVKYFRFT